MKRLYTILVALAAFTATASAQFGWGLEAGLNLNKISFSGDLTSNIEATNRAGFFIGPKFKFTVPIIGIGGDVALLYDNKQAAYTYTTTDGTSTTSSKTLHYISIPLNVRYQLDLKVIGIYAVTGPQWNWNVGNRDWTLEQVWDATTSSVTNLSQTFNKSSLSWNVGAGIILFSHLNVGFTYNIPITRGGNIIETFADNTVQTAKDLINGDTKNNTWQVRVGYFF